MHLPPLSMSKTFSSPQTEAAPIKQKLPSPSYSLSYLSSAFCLYEFVYSKYLILSGLTQYLCSCVWIISLSMFSGFIHIVAWIRTSFFFMTEYYSIVWLYRVLFIHSYVYRHLVVSTFWLLRIVLEWTLTYRYLSEFLLSLLSAVYLGVELLGHEVTLCVTFWGAEQSLFLTAVSPFYMPISDI